MFIRPTSLPFDAYQRECGWAYNSYDRCNFGELRSESDLSKIATLHLVEELRLYEMGWD